jgi:hypothetical protein
LDERGHLLEEVRDRAPVGVRGGCGRAQGDSQGADRGAPKGEQRGFGDDAECASAAATECPEQVRVLAFIGCDNVALRRDDLHLKDVVGAETVDRANGIVAATRQVAPNADVLAHAADYGEVMGAQGAVDVFHQDAGADSDGGLVQAVFATLWLEI